MSQSYMKPSSVLWTTLLFLSIALKSCCCQARGTNNSSSNDDRGPITAQLLREELRRKLDLVDRINLFLVTVPSLVLFAFVVACYTMICKQQRLHGWIVLAVTGSFSLRFLVIFLIELPKFYFHWKPQLSFSGLCVTYGE